MDTEKIVLGVYLMILGFVMIAFHKDVAKLDDAVRQFVPFIWRPTGRFRTVMIIVFAAASILIGVTLLLVVFVPQ